MVIFLIIGVVAGILFGICFKVLVLIPAFLLATAVILANGSGHTLIEILVAVLATVVSIQFGYIVGSVLRALARAHLPTAPRY
jgi:hypothetical protein